MSAYEQYRKIETPEGVALEPCPLCDGPAVLWRHSETAESPTTVAVMCEHGDPIGPQSNLFSGCLLFMPNDDFFRATMREAVAYWNDFANALIALRLGR